MGYWIEYFKEDSIRRVKCVKVCTKCKVEKDLSEFHRKGTGYQSQCGECRRSYDKALYDSDPDRKALKLRSATEYKAGIRQWYNLLKEGKVCTDCGNSYHFAAMQWDHLPGFTKHTELAKLVKAGGKKAILEEIAKCELVCANCHSVRTYNRASENRLRASSNLAEAS